MRRVSTVFLLIFFAIAGVWAGDIATFIELGFSADSRYYMFGYYGVNPDNAVPYAEIYAVDVQKNDFTYDGSFKSSVTERLQPGQDAMGTLLDLYDKTRAVRDKYKISPVRTGRLIYVLLDGVKPDRSIDFRDFAENRRYLVTLNQSVEGLSSTLKSSFYLDVAVSLETGKTITRKVGSPEIKRPKIESYEIKRVILAPDRASLIIVVMKKFSADAGSNVRFMVETVKLY